MNTLGKEEILFFFPLRRHSLLAEIPDALVTLRWVYVKSQSVKEWDAFIEGVCCALSPAVFLGSTKVILTA